MDIIAEVGSNHQGQLDTALRLIEAAAWAGATHVKFQLFHPERLYPTNGHLRERAKLQALPKEWLLKLHLAALEHGILFGVSVFDIESIPVAVPYCDFLKVASSSFYMNDLHSMVGAQDVDVFVSIPANAPAAEIFSFYSWRNPERFCCLVTSTQYPTPIWDAGVARVATLARTYPHKRWGYSNHTRSLNIGAATYLLNGSAVECHLCLKGQQDTPDIAVSFTPNQFRTMAVRTREAIDLMRLSHPTLGEGERIMQNEKGERV